MTEITNGELMAVLLDIKGKVSHNEGKVDGFIEEVRAAFVRADNGARAQDDRINGLSGDIASFKTSTARESGHKEGHKEHRDFVGHIVTGAVAFGAMFAAMWSGVVHPTH